MQAPDQAPHDSDAAIAAAAGVWVARRDRGLTAAEQDAFSDWLGVDPRHRIAVSRLDHTWAALDSLAAWQPADGTAPNPDLLAPAPVRSNPRARWLLWFAGLGAAATVAFSLWRLPSHELAGNVRGVRVIPPPERQLLADGSVAEVNHGGQFDVAFAPQERRVRLRDGEVHLSVAKDTTRPFVVEAGAIRVRAVGTAFNVRLERDGVEVLVTEGVVEVEQPPSAPQPVAAGERARVSAGQRPVVTTEKPETVARELAWRAVRLEFEGLPLHAVVAEFNLRNARQLAIGDSAAGNVRVAGTFRADEPEAFARLLEAGFGLTVDRPATGAWVLRTAAPRAGK